MTERITIYVDERTKRELQIAATERGISVTEAVRDHLPYITQYVQGLAPAYDELEDDLELATGYIIDLLRVIYLFQRRRYEHAERILASVRLDIAEHMPDAIPWNHDDADSSQ